MPVPFGFSVGDCISVCILIKDAIQALDSSRGSSAEYQEVIRELWALDRALLEVVNLAQSFETTVELNALSHTARRSAEQCKSCIETFLGRIKEYERALREGGSGNKFRDVKGKMTWALYGREHLVKFRTEINGHSSAINMLLITASVSLTKLNDKNLQERMEITRRANEVTANEQSMILGQVKDTLDEHTRTLQAQETTAMRLAERMKYFFTLGAELQAFMARIWTLNFRSYNILLDLQTRVPREFEPCWIQEPLTLTDALGRVAPIHLELINSWHVLESVLTARFKNIPGERKVMQGEYALQDRGSLRDIEKSQDFEACFLPGRKVDMSMIFKQSHTLVRSCPGCLLETKEDSAVATICKNCGLWFQRVEEVVDQEQQEPFIVEPVLQSTETAATPATTHRQSPLDRKRKIENVDVEDSMSMFKRVRLMSGTARTRGMRGAATAAQQRMANLGRSETPEATIFHYHETRTSAWRSGGRGAREESVENPQMIVKLKIGKEKFRKFIRDLKTGNKPSNLQQTPSFNHAQSGLGTASEYGLD